MGLAKFLRRPWAAWTATRGVSNQKILTDQEHLRLSAQFIAASHRHAPSGFAFASFDLAHSWRGDRRGEGLIIETLRRLAETLGDPQLEALATASEARGAPVTAPSPDPLETGLQTLQDAGALAGDPQVRADAVEALNSLWDAYEASGETRWRDEALALAEPLLRGALGATVFFCDYPDNNRGPRSKGKNVWLMSLWARFCYRALKETGRAEYRDAAELSLYYALSKQLQDAGELTGAVPFRAPFWAEDENPDFPPAAAAALAAAILEGREFARPRWQVQELYVKYAHMLALDDGRWDRHSRTLNTFDVQMMNAVEHFLAQSPAGESMVVLDLGCGRLRHIEYLAPRHPEARFYGVDPTIAEQEGDFRYGSGCYIPFPDNSFDVVYTLLSMVHVDDLDRVLAEVRRVLKPGGIFIEGTFSPISLRGFKKPLLELQGRWIYAWDSPFRERWRRYPVWRKALSRGGYQYLGRKEYAFHGKVGLKKFLPINRFYVLGARLTGKRPDEANHLVSDLAQA